MNYRKYFFNFSIGIVVILCLRTSVTFAQSSQLLNVNEINSLYLSQLYHIDSNVHTAIRPIMESDFKPKFQGELENNLFSFKSRGDLGLIHIGNEENSISVYPILNIIPGFEIERGPLIDQNSEVRMFLSNGISLNGSIRRKFSFNMNYMYAYSNYNGYFQRSAASRGALQGFGTMNRDGDYLTNHYFDGYLSYSPTQVFNFQVGNGRNFIGDGYRSLLLSDYAYNYPYFKITTSIWKIKYMNLYAMQYDMAGNPADFNQINTKFSSSHYLSVNIGKRWNVGIFESVIWRGKDSTYNRSFDINYLNPVIFLRPVEYSVGSPDNVLIGLNSSYKYKNWLVLYGQLMLDEFLLKEVVANDGWWANKYAYQLGIKSTFNSFNFQLEYSTATPYTYTHSAAAQNYGHFNLPLAHPLGANFEEIVAIFRYQYKRFLLESYNTYGRFGEGNDTLNYGQDIFVSNNTRIQEYGNYTLQGSKRDVFTSRLQCNYIINAARGVSFTIGGQYRSDLDQGGRHSSYSVYAGIKTSLFNSYSEY